MRFKYCFGGNHQIPLCCQQTILVACRKCFLLRDLVFFLSPVLFFTAQLLSVALHMFDCWYLNVNMSLCSLKLSFYFCYITTAVTYWACFFFTFTHMS